jgi:predicted MFS family arabinose efflux permease
LELSPAEDRESAVALYQTVVAISAVLGPFIGGFIVYASGCRLALFVGACGRWISMIMFVALVRNLKKKSPSA